MANEHRTIDITEVDPGTRTIRGRDEHGQLVALTNQFLQPIITVPQVGEKWLINHQGNQWLLDRRFDQDDKLLGLESGDVHIDAKNNLIITSAQKIIVNGQEYANNVKVLAEGGQVLTANQIKFVSNDQIQYYAFEDTETGSIDIRSSLKLPEVVLSNASPVGSVNPYAGSTAPDGWLLCDGASYLRADYADLFAVIGTSYGAADGTHFNVPDMRGRFPVGKGTHADVDALGDNDGSALADRRPKHKHTATSTDAGHTHGITVSGADDNNHTGNGPAAANSDAAQNATNNSNSGVANITTTVGPQTNVPIDAPAYLTLNYIIKI